MVVFLLRCRFFNCDFWWGLIGGGRERGCSMRCGWDVGVFVFGFVVDIGKELFSSVYPVCTRGNSNLCSVD